MKGLILSVLVLLLLTGCVSVPEPPPMPAESTAATAPETSAPADPFPETSAPTESVPEATVSPEPAPSDFVRVRDYIPDITVELRYAGEDNFTGQRIYSFSDAWLRYGTVQKLMSVQRELSQRGLSLKIWDAFRPVAAQFTLWDVYPDPTYVANPLYGYSSHSRGNTVDVTLTTADGRELEMPTGFDDFSVLADRNYSDCPTQAAANAYLLEQVMEKFGFTPYFGEWWHFSDTDPYPVEEQFSPSSDC